MNQEASSLMKEPPPNKAQIAPAPEEDASRRPEAPQHRSPDYLHQKLAKKLNYLHYLNFHYKY
jgi:hypothetical protein